MAKLARTLVVAAVALPPPVHGQAVVSAGVITALQQEECTVRVYDISPQSLHRGLTYHGRRMVRVARAGWGIFSTRHAGPKTFYAVAEAGAGLGYMALLVLLARLRGYRIFLHHHTTTQVKKRRGLLALVMWLAGKNGVQIALSFCMAKNLRQTYPFLRAEQVLVCGNAVHLPGDLPKISLTAKPNKTLRLGILGNLSVVKGALDALNIAAKAFQHRLDITLILAGPVLEPKVRQAIDETQPILEERLQLLGAVTAQEKATFFKQIDVLLFPSRYRHEAQPLVVLEALRSGVPVLAYEQGYVSELLGAPQPMPGVLIPLNEDFSSSALPLLMARNVWKNPGKRKFSQQRFAALHADCVGQLQQLLKAMMNA